MSIPLASNDGARPDAVSVNALLSIGSGTKANIRTLVVDDEHSLRETCGSLLTSAGHDVTVCGRGHEALDILKRQPFDIALVDLYMSQVDGLTLLRAALATNPGTIVIMMTGNPSIESSIEALRQGAWDYLPKPFSAQHLQITMGRAAHTVLVARETRDQQEDPERSQEAGEKVALLGTSAPFRRVIELARRVAPTDASVFITGESGSGKELIAQFIHQHSRRSSRPFVAVNCAALPEALLESEMFGHRKGAFTGAVRDKRGLRETANGGTLFLDELIEMSKPIQAKLLRVIQDGVVRRVGSETTDAVVNVRFIAATNCDPEMAVRRGALRQDLYYRLRVVPIHVPALRERPEDIPLLANHFLAYYWTRHRDPKLPLPKFTKPALFALRAQAWPGNVRELQNVIEHAVVLLQPGASVEPENIPFISDSGEPPEATLGTDSAEEDGYFAARERLLTAFDRRFLARLVAMADGNLAKAARLASVDRTTPYRLLERYGLQRTSPAPPAERPPYHGGPVSRLRRGP